MPRTKMEQLRNAACYANSYMDAKRTITERSFPKDWRPKDPRINPPLRRRVRAFNTTGNQNPNSVPGTPGIGTPA